MGAIYFLTVWLLSYSGRVDSVDVVRDVFGPGRDVGGVGVHGIVIDATFFIEFQIMVKVAADGHFFLRQSVRCHCIWR